MIALYTFFVFLELSTFDEIKLCIYFIASTITGELKMNISNFSMNKVDCFMVHQVRCISKARWNEFMNFKWC